MRRNDKEITDRAEQDQILRTALFCHVGMIRSGLPYVIPMNFGYDGEAIYLHCAPEGVKLDALRANPAVSLSVETDVALLTTERACNYTMRYRSLVIEGRVTFLTDPAEKKRALTVIAEKYAKSTVEIPDASLEKLTLLRVTIHAMTGKKSRID